MSARIPRGVYCACGKYHDTSGVFSTTVLVVRLDSVGLSETCYKHFIWCDNPVITLCDWRKSECGFICVALDTI